MITTLETGSALTGVAPMKTGSGGEGSHTINCKVSKVETPNFLNS